MDLSKLPKLSSSDAPPQAETPAPATLDRPLNYTRRGADPRARGDAVVSFLIALILLAINSRPLAYIRHRMTGYPFGYSFWDEKNAPMEYVKTVFFVGDIALLIFALAVLLESIVLAFRPTRPLVLLALAMTIISTAFNLFYVIWSFNTYGLALLSACAVVFGAYTVSWQWRLFQDTNPRAAIGDLHV